jgi:hypothetical protein
MTCFFALARSFSFLLAFLFWTWTINAVCYCLNRLHPGSAQNINLNNLINFQKLMKSLNPFKWDAGESFNLEAISPASIASSISLPLRALE